MDKSHDFTQRHKLQYSITRVCGSDGFKRVKSLDVAVFEMTPEEEKKSNFNGRNSRALKITQNFKTRLFVALKSS